VLVIEAGLVEEDLEFIEEAIPPAIDVAVVDSSHTVVDKRKGEIVTLDAETCVAKIRPVLVMDVLEPNEVTIPPAVDVADGVSEQSSLDIKVLLGYPRGFNSEMGEYRVPSGTIRGEPEAEFKFKPAALKASMLNGALSQ
jgi:hypothetical protein